MLVVLGFVFLLVVIGQKVIIISICVIRYHRTFTYSYCRKALIQNFKKKNEMVQIGLGKKISKCPI